MLRQQLRAIQRELGDEGEDAEVEDLRKRVEDLKLPKDIRKEVDRELQRLERINVASPEYGVLRGHLEFLVELPWDILTDGDLRRSLVRDPACLSQPVREHMTPDPRTIGPEAPAREAVELLKQHHIDELAVVDTAGALLGYLDIQDVA